MSIPTQEEISIPAMYFSNPNPQSTSAVPLAVIHPPSMWCQESMMDNNFPSQLYPQLVFQPPPAHNGLSQKQLNPARFLDNDVNLAPNVDMFPNNAEQIRPFFQMLPSVSIAVPQNGIRDLNQNQCINSLFQLAPGALRVPIPDNRRDNNAPGALRVPIPDNRRDNHIAAAVPHIVINPQCLNQTDLTSFLRNDEKTTSNKKRKSSRSDPNVQKKSTGDGVRSKIPKPSNDIIQPPISTNRSSGEDGKNKKSNRHNIVSDNDSSLRYSSKTTSTSTGQREGTYELTNNAHSNFPVTDNQPNFLNVNLAHSNIHPQPASPKTTELGMQYSLDYTSHGFTTTEVNRQCSSSFRTQEPDIFENANGCLFKENVTLYESSNQPNTNSVPCHDIWNNFEISPRSFDSLNTTDIPVVVTERDDRSMATTSSKSDSGLSSRFCSGVSHPFSLDYNDNQINSVTTENLRSTAITASKRYHTSDNQSHDVLNRQSLRYTTSNQTSPEKRIQQLVLQFPKALYSSASGLAQCSTTFSSLWPPSIERDAIDNLESTVTAPNRILVDNHQTLANIATSKLNFHHLPDKSAALEEINASASQQQALTQSSSVPTTSPLSNSNSVPVSARDTNKGLNTVLTDDHQASPNIPASQLSSHHLQARSISLEEFNATTSQQQAQRQSCSVPTTSTLGNSIKNVPVSVRDKNKGLNARRITLADDTKSTNVSKDVLSHLPQKSFYRQLKDKTKTSHQTHLNSKPSHSLSKIRNGTPNRPVSAMDMNDEFLTDLFTKGPSDNITYNFNVERHDVNCYVVVNSASEDMRNKRENGKLNLDATPFENTAIKESKLKRNVMNKENEETVPALEEADYEPDIFDRSPPILVIDEDYDSSQEEVPESSDKIQSLNENHHPESQTTTQSSTSTDPLITHMDYQIREGRAQKPRVSAEKIKSRVLTKSIDNINNNEETSLDKYNIVKNVSASVSNTNNPKLEHSKSKAQSLTRHKRSGLSDANLEKRTMPVVSSADFCVTAALHSPIFISDQAPTTYPVIVIDDDSNDCSVTYTVSQTDPLGLESLDTFAVTQGAEQSGNKLDISKISSVTRNENQGTLHCTDDGESNGRSIARDSRGSGNGVIENAVSMRPQIDSASNENVPLEAQSVQGNTCRTKLSSPAHGQHSLYEAATLNNGKSAAKFEREHISTISSQKFSEFKVTRTDGVKENPYRLETRYFPATRNLNDASSAMPPAESLRTLHSAGGATSLVKSSELQRDLTSGARSQIYNEDEDFGTDRANGNQYRLETRHFPETNLISSLQGAMQNEISTHLNPNDVDTDNSGRNIATQHESGLPDAEGADVPDWHPPRGHSTPVKMQPPVCSQSSTESPNSNESRNHVERDRVPSSPSIQNNRFFYEDISVDEDQPPPVKENRNHVERDRLTSSPSIHNNRFFYEDISVDEDQPLSMQKSRGRVESRVTSSPSIHNNRFFYEDISVDEDQPPSVYNNRFFYENNTIIIDLNVDKDQPPQLFPFDVTPARLAALEGKGRESRARGNREDAKREITTDNEVCVVEVKEASYLQALSSYDRNLAYKMAVAIKEEIRNRHVVEGEDEEDGVEEQGQEQ